MSDKKKPKIPNGAAAIIVARKQAIIKQSPQGMWSEIYKPTRPAKKGKK